MPWAEGLVGDCLGPHRHRSMGLTTCMAETIF